MVTENPYEAPAQTGKPDESEPPFYARRLPPWFVICFFWAILLVPILLLMAAEIQFKSADERFFQESLNESQKDSDRQNDAAERPETQHERDAAVKVRRSPEP